ncbi:hypothetical protein K0B03_02960 [Patescibacteria group bacterium]|nr:hypothetical protein [Patescibacteria group bacterium]
MISQIKNYNSLDNKKGNIPIEFEILIVTFVLSLIIIFFVAVPQYKELKINASHVELIKKNIELKKKAIVSLSNFETEKEVVREDDLMKIKGLLPAEDVSEIYIANINRIAELPVSKMNILSLGVSGSAKGAANKSFSLRKTTINLSLVGKYDKFLVFLGQMEKIAPLIYVESFSIAPIISDNYIEGQENKTNTNGGDYTVNVDMTLSFFYK